MDRTTEKQEICFDTAGNCWCMVPHGLGALRKFDNVKHNAGFACSIHCYGDPPPDNHHTVLRPYIWSCGTSWLLAGYIYDRQDRKKDNPDYRIHCNGGIFWRTWRISPAAFISVRGTILNYLRTQLLLHRVRSQCDNLHLPTRGFSHEPQGSGIRGFSGWREDWSIHRHFPECLDTWVINW